MADGGILLRQFVALGGDQVEMTVTPDVLRGIVPIVDRIGRRLQSRSKAALVVADLERILVLVTGRQAAEIQAWDVTAVEIHRILDLVASAAGASGDARLVAVGQALGNATAGAANRPGSEE